AGFGPKRPAEVQNGERPTLALHGGRREHGTHTADCLPAIPSVSRASTDRLLPHGRRCLLSHAVAAAFGHRRQRSSLHNLVARRAVATQLLSVGVSEPWRAT